MPQKCVRVHRRESCNHTSYLFAHTRRPVLTFVAYRQCPIVFFSADFAAGDRLLLLLDRCSSVCPEYLVEACRVQVDRIVQLVEMGEWLLLRAVVAVMVAANVVLAAGWHRGRAALVMALWEEMLGALLLIVALFETETASV